MKEFDGQMDKTAKKTVKGLMSQIKDTFAVSVVEKWGAGLQKGVLSGLDKFNAYMTKNRGNLEKIGETLGKWGEQISMGAVAEIEKLGRKIGALTSSPEWAKATTLGDKVKLVWAEVIEKPFAEWWNTRGKTKVTEWAETIGGSLGAGLGNFIMRAAGVATSADELANASPFVQAGVSAGNAFFDAFSKAFDAEKVAQSLIDAFKRAAGNFATDATNGGGMSASNTLFGLFGAWGAGKIIGGAFKGGKNAAKGAGWLKNFFGGGKAAAGASGAAGSAAKAGVGAIDEAMLAFGSADDVARAAAAAAKAGSFASKAAKGVPVVGTLIAGGAAIGQVAAAPKGQKDNAAARAGGGILGGVAAGAGVGAGLGAIGANPLTIGIGGVVGAIAGGIVGEAAVGAFYDKIEAKIKGKQSETSGKYEATKPGYSPYAPSTAVGAITMNIQPKVTIEAKDTDAQDILKVFKDNIVGLSDEIGNELGRGLEVSFANMGRLR